MPEIVSPFSEPRDGFLYLGQVILWLASEGGVLDTDAAAARWEQSEQVVFDALASGVLVAEGADAGGVYCELPHGVWALASSRYDSARPSISYPDKTVGETFGGTLKASMGEWTGIRIRKAYIAARWGNVPRTALITRVGSGVMTPEEGEAAADRLGVAPLLEKPDPAKLDPMKEVFWTLPMALAWLMTRNVEAVREVWPPWRDANEFWKPWRAQHSEPPQ
jgi:hypothetical protein